MKKIFLICFWLLVAGSIFVRSAFAQGTCDPGSYCSDCSFTTSPGGLVEGEFDTIEFSFKVDDTGPPPYIIESDGPDVPVQLNGRFRSGPISPDPSTGEVKITITQNQARRLFESCETLSKIPNPFVHCPGTHLLRILREGVGGEYCPPYRFDPLIPTPTPPACELNVWADDGEFTAGSQIVVEGKNMPGDSSWRTNYQAAVYKKTDPNHLRAERVVNINIQGGFFRALLGKFNNDNYEVVVLQEGIIEIPCRGGEFSICPSGCGAPTPVPPPPICPKTCQDLIDEGKKNIACADPICQMSCTQCGFIPIPRKPSKVYKICEALKMSPGEKTKCIECIRDEKGMWTALGCLPLDIKGFIEYLLSWGASIAGGIALLLIIYGGFKILTSAGNPEGVAAGKEVITAAIVGLLMIIFSVLILKIIGIDILRIPELGPSPTPIPTPPPAGVRPGI